MERESGIVKFFDARKGWGFVTRSNGENIFVHFSAIQQEGFRELLEGEVVSFVAERGPKGPFAVEVIRDGIQ